MTFPTRKQADYDASEKSKLRQGGLPQVRRVRRDAHRRADSRELRGVPPLRPAPQARRRRAGASCSSTTGSSTSGTPTSSRPIRSSSPTARRYPERVAAAQQGVEGAKEAMEIGRAKIERHAIAYGAFLFAFMGGSMGSVVGEKVTRLFERADRRATARRAPPRLGRRAHAGGDPEPDADGQGGRRARAAARGAPAVHQRAAPPDDGRRRRELRAPRRREHRRAEGAHRLRRAARHREHDPPEAAGGIPARASSSSRTGWSTASRAAST